ncbi:hypothetical protein Droror1_Dr00004630 [Drosera rotundifolia]
MENVSGFHGMEQQQPMELPPGFRFHPTDEELITHYLSPKVLDSGFTCRAIGDIDLNKCEPWDLPKLAKMGEKEWYFFCMRDRKYPTGLRTNRATDAGYWKATGKDKEIFRGKSLVGMKKTLVFYKGRAPKGQKSNWVMHEYRLDGKFSLQNLPPTAKNEWVICRVFQKSAGGKKVYYPGMMRSDSLGTDLGPSGLPPLMESSSYGDQTKSGIPGSVHVPCFSSPMMMTNAQGSNLPPIFEGFNPINAINCNTNSSFYFQRNNGMVNPMYVSQVQENNNFMSDQVRVILETNYGAAMKRHSMKAEREMLSVSQDTCLTSDMNAEISSSYELGKGPFDDHEGPSTSGGPVDIDSLWNY